MQSGLEGLMRESGKLSGWGIFAWKWERDRGRM